MAQQRVDLVVQEGAHRLGVIGDLCLEEQEMMRSMGWAGFGKEMRVSRGHDAVDYKAPCVEMVGVEAVLLPGVVTEHDVRLHDPDHLADALASGAVTVELSVDDVQHMGGGDTERRCRVLLFSSASRGQRGRI